MAKETHKLLITLTSLIKTLSYVLLQCNGHTVRTNYVLPPPWCWPAFFCQAALPE